MRRCLAERDDRPSRNRSIAQRVRHSDRTRSIPAPALVLPPAAAWEQGRGSVGDLVHALRDMTPNELAALTRGTKAARVFQKDADKATASVLFCLAEAANIVGSLKRAPGDGPSLSFNDFHQALPRIEHSGCQVRLCCDQPRAAARRNLY